jgi:hypothetical protein
MIRSLPVIFILFFLLLTIRPHCIRCKREYARLFYLLASSINRKIFSLLFLSIIIFHGNLFFFFSSSSYMMTFLSLTCSILRLEKEESLHTFLCSISQHRRTNHFDSSYITSAPIIS